MLCTSEIRKVKGHQRLKALEEEKIRKDNEMIEMQMQASRNNQPANQNQQTRSRKLQVEKVEEVDDGIEIRKINTNELETDDGFSKKPLVEEMKDGKQSMLLLYEKNYIREIIIVCKIN